MALLYSCFVIHDYKRSNKIIVWPRSRLNYKPPESDVGISARQCHYKKTTRFSWCFNDSYTYIRSHFQEYIRRWGLTRPRKTDHFLPSERSVDVGVSARRMLHAVLHLGDIKISQQRRHIVRLLKTPSSLVCAILPHPARYVVSATPYLHSRETSALNILMESMLCSIGSVCTWEYDWLLLGSLAVLS